ncbi:MAG: transcriptional repressor [Spirochaetes bacterium RBG_16_49_21]|nr:MAG: transcriptional repressor [Spirochaetes bacterium RBG_16_49_21]
MPLHNELAILNGYIRKNNLKSSSQRGIILEAFLSSNRHITADELRDIIKIENPNIGIATIYRTMKLLCECGLCRELILEDGKTRFEAVYDHEHHDHLICTKCGAFVEILSPEIEKLQKKIARKNGFILKSHRLNLYGICKACSK